MESYIIAFDIVVDKFPRVKEILNRFPESSPIHKSCWVVKSSKKPSAIRGEFAKVLEREAGMIVIRSGTYSAWINDYNQEINEEIKRLL